MPIATKITYELSLVERIKTSILRKMLAQKSERHLREISEPMAIMAFDYIGNEISIHGLYEHQELEHLFCLLEGFDFEFKLGTAYDVGANIGNHSRYFANNFGRVIAFEPNPQIVDILRINTRSYTNISIRECAVGDFQGETTIFGNQKNIGGFSVFQDRKTSPKETSESQVILDKICVITLDSIFQEIENLTFIKIDVEGFEFQVLKGATRTIQHFKPVIAFEQWPTDFKNSHSQSINFLSEMGYVFYWQSQYSVSNNKIIRYMKKCKQIVLGKTEVYFQYSKQVLPGHYSMLVAVHEAKKSKMAQ